MEADNLTSGWCGNSTDYCDVSVGCQSACGTCTNDTTTTSGGGTGGTSTNGQCGPGFGTCNSNECCSLAGYWYVSHRDWSSGSCPELAWT
jgi:hypothetical protein